MRKPSRAEAPIADTFQALERQALELLWADDPVHASLLGIERYDGLLPRTEAGARADFCWRAGDLLARLERLPDGADLAPAARAERWALGSLLRVPLAMEQEFSPFTRNPVLYLEGLLHGIFILFQRAEPLDEQRAQAVCSRLREASRLLDEATCNLRPHAARVPACWAEACLQLVRGGEALIRETAAAVKRAAPALARDAETCASEALARVTDYADFIRRDILPRARGSFAVGRDLFLFLLGEQHHLPYREVDLLEWGRHEVHEARRELEQLGRRIDPGRHWREILDSLRLDHPALDELVPAYREQVERVRRFVAERGLASIPEDDDLQVRETPEFERSVTPFAAYLPPPTFGVSRRGSLWVTPPDAHLKEEERRQVLSDHCRSRIPITALHETYPGHHLQFSRMCSLESAVRRHYATAVFVEGWALYCEEMMIEQQYLSDPRSRLCQLRDHLWRACRVVLDVRLHTEAMDPRQAARTLVEESCLPAPTAAAEVARYTQTPTQPLSYLIGKREIQALRREVERARGRAFRLGEFHDQLLGQGPIPIDFVRDILLAPERAPARC